MAKDAFTIEGYDEQMKQLKQMMTDGGDNNNPPSGELEG